MKFSTIFSQVVLPLVEDILRPWSGPIGIRLRRLYYKRRLRACGDRLTIGPGVHIVCPDLITVGSDVWMDQGCTLIAGLPHSAFDFEASQELSNASAGKITIGNAAHLGIGAIIQGHGGVQIGHGFTLAPHAKVYSYSNDYRRCRAGTVPHELYRPSYRLTPVTIGENVWVGLNAIVIGHRVGDDCFIRPGSVVTQDIDENSVVSGDPAVRVDSRFFDAPNSTGALL